MADKKKMSVADMLAAARKADSGSASAGEKPTETAAEAASTSEAAPAAAEASAPAAIPAAPAQKVPASGAGRPSVAEMMAMARAKAGGEANFTVRLLWRSGPT